MNRLLPLALLGFALAAPAPVAAQFGDPFTEPPKKGRPADPFGGDTGAKTGANVKPIGDLGEAKLELDRKEARRGETVVAKLTITPKNGGYTYPFFPKDPDQLAKNSLSLPKPGDLIFLTRQVTDPPGAETHQREGAPPGVMDQYYPGPGPVTWELRAVVSPQANLGRTTIDLGRTRLQVCKEQCITITRDQLPTAELEIVGGEPRDVNPADLAAATAILADTAQPPVRGGGNVPGTGPPAVTPSAAPGPAPAAEPGRKVARPIAEYEAELDALAGKLTRADSQVVGVQTAQQGGLWAFLATAALWGLISLVTPCVFPMIPITVSIFLKQAHGSLWERLKLAGVYCLTIITVLGLSAFALLKFMAWLSAHPVTNLALAGLFLVLALSLFGMYDIALPGFMTRRLQARQAKGGVLGTIFGALAFTVISFTCVAPFLGGFAGISAADTGGSLVAVPTTREVFGGLAFATAFAAPFFVLALVPGLMRALPRSGGWLDSVKVVMGFLELAAALKFLRTAELRLLPTPAYFTYDLVMAGWVAISLACGLYLLNVYRLPHDEERPNIGVPRLLFATLFLGLGLYLLPAMFKAADGKAQRPAGAVYAWVDAFLLPEPSRESTAGWGTDLPAALDRARQSGRPVFVDFTGVTCTNCKYNEENVFPRPEVRELFQGFERVQLYTDEVPAGAYATDPGHDRREQEAEYNRQFQIAAFKDSALPLYAVLMPQADGTVRVVGVYDEGKINAPDRFARFLAGALEKTKK